MSSYFLGQLVGGFFGAAVVAFIIARLLTKGVVPFVVALGAGVVGMAAVLGMNTLAGKNGVGLTVQVTSLEKGFSSSCVSGCAKSGGTEEKCKAPCACLLLAIHKKYPTDEQFVHWFTVNATHVENVKQEMTEMSAGCTPTQPQ